MKNFEDKFEGNSCGSENACDCECGHIPVTCEECKVIAEYWYRQALEFAENQFINKSAFEAEETINKELRDLP